MDLSILLSYNLNLYLKKVNGWHTRQIGWKLITVQIAIQLSGDQ